VQDKSRLTFIRPGLELDLDLDSILALRVVNYSHKRHLLWAETSRSSHSIQIGEFSSEEEANAECERIGCMVRNQK
jgi:hypothetical protein